MNNIVVLYQSKYGATKKYAQWIGQKLGCDVMETKSASIGDVKNYDTIILGGGVYANGINGISFLTGNINELKNKKIIVFGVGATPCNDNYINKIRDHNLKDKLEGVPFVYCRGEWNEEVFTFKDKLLIGMFKKMLGKKDKSSMPAYEVEMIESLNEKQDWTDEKYIEQIIQLI